MGERGISLFKMFSIYSNPSLTDVCPCQFEFTLLQKYRPDDLSRSLPALHLCEDIGSSQLVGKGDSNSY